MNCIPYELEAFIKANLPFEQEQEFYDHLENILFSHSLNELRYFRHNTEPVLSIKIECETPVKFAKCTFIVCKEGIALKAVEFVSEQESHTILE